MESRSRNFPAYPELGRSKETLEQKAAKAEKIRVEAWAATGSANAAGRYVPSEGERKPAKAAGFRGGRYISAQASALARFYGSARPEASLRKHAPCWRQFENLHAALKSARFLNPFFFPGIYHW
ncbi:MAG TPA: hypothetical protein VIY49_36440 [Bryobacteraceae bacterium]